MSFFMCLLSSFLVQADANIKNVSLGTIRVGTLTRHLNKETVYIFLNE